MSTTLARPAKYFFWFFDKPEDHIVFQPQFQGCTLRNEYYNFLGEKKKTLAKEHPSWTPKEVLEEARKMSEAYMLWL